MKRTKPKRAQRSHRAVDLSTIDGSTAAMMLPVGPNRQILVKGDAVFQVDDSLGRILRIRVQDPDSGVTDLVIQEDEWKGRIIPDVKYGCDYCLIAAEE